MTVKPTVERKITMLKCQRCGHEWVPRKKVSEVRLCAKCKSPYWDIPKKG